MPDKNLLIELIYDEELTEQAEALFLAGAVTDVTMAEQNLYTARVKDGIFYETEIQSPFLKKQKATCDCIFYRENNICKHIISLLFELREVFKAREDEQKNKLTSGLKKHSSLNIAHILQVADHDELTHFLRNYAKTDKKFATQLKVHFARKIDLADNTDKYRNILNSLVRPHTGMSGQASASDIRAIIQVLEDFGAQIDDCLALGQFREAFNIFETSFSKLEYIRHYYTHHKEKLDRLSLQYHIRIQQISNEKLPPELKKEMLEFLLDMAQRSYYHFDHPVYNILQLIKKDKDITERILLILQQLMKHRNAAESAVLLSLYHKQMKKITRNDISLYNDNKVALKDVADHLIALNEDILALKLLQLFEKNTVFDREISNRMILLYVKMKEKKSLLAAATKAFVHTGDFRYFEIVQREADENEWNEWLEYIESTVAASDKDGSLMCKLYRRAEMWQHLASYLRSKNSIELLMANDSYLYKKDRNLLLELYKTIVFSYLDTHLGEQATMFIQNILKHLKAEDMDAVSSGLKAFITEQFAHRTTLSAAFD